MHMDKMRIRTGIGKNDTPVIMMRHFDILVMARSTENCLKAEIIVINFTI